MTRYRCPEDDYEQEEPGVCPNHPDKELVMVEGEEETRGEGTREEGEE